MPQIISTDPKNQHEPSPVRGGVRPQELQFNEDESLSELNLSANRWVPGALLTFHSVLATLRDPKTGNVEAPASYPVFVGIMVL